MEYGEQDLRILTEIDRIEKQRPVYRFVLGGEEQTELADKNGQRERWDFIVENPLYGKMICSYYPEEAVKELRNYYAAFFSYEKDGEEYVQGIPMSGCTSEATAYLRTRMQQGIHDALCSLILEARVHGLSESNGRTFVRPDLDTNKGVTQIQNYNKTRLRRRLNARRGPKKNRALFIKRVYEAYCKAADEAEQPGESNKITQKHIAKFLPNKKNQNNDFEGIDVRTFGAQLADHQVNYAYLMEMFELWRNMEKQSTCG